MVKVYPYLFVENCKKAIKLYEKVFGAKLITHMPIVKETGQQMGFPDDFNYDESTMHAIIEINGAQIMLADMILPLSMAGKSLEDLQFENFGNMEVMLEPENEEQIKDFYKKAKDLGFTIKMELMKREWGAWFARFEDTEGIGWQLNYSPQQ